MNTTIKRLEADLARWRAAFPGKTPEEANQLLKKAIARLMATRGKFDSWKKYGTDETNMVIIELCYLLREPFTTDEAIKIQGSNNITPSENSLQEEIDQLKRERDEVNRIVAELRSNNEVQGKYTAGVINDRDDALAKLAASEANLQSLRVAANAWKSALDKSLSSDCGKDYISRAEAEAAMVEAKAELCELKETLNLIRATGIIHVKPPKIEPQNNE